MTSQLVIFRAFLFIFFRPPTLDLKKNSRKSTNKNNLALEWNTSNEIHCFLLFCFICLNKEIIKSKTSTSKYYQEMPRVQVTFMYQSMAP